MKDLTTPAAGGASAIGATTIQGDPLTVAIGQTLPGGRRHVALRWPYAAPYGPDDAPADLLDGVDLTSGEALALGVLLVRAHDRIEREPAAGEGHPVWCRAHHGDVPARHEAIIGRVRFEQPGGAAGVIGVRVARSDRRRAASIGVHYHRDPMPEDEARLLWLSLREAAVFAGVLDVLGADRAAALVRRAVALATDLHTDQEESR